LTSKFGGVRNVPVDFFFCLLAVNGSTVNGAHDQRDIFRDPLSESQTGRDEP
jgi:hypothetical protein